MAGIKYEFTTGNLKSLEDLIKERVRTKLLDAYVHIEQDVITQLSALHRRFVAYELIELSHQFGGFEDENNLIVKIIDCYNKENTENGKTKKKKNAKK